MENMTAYEFTQYIDKSNISIKELVREMPLSIIIEKMIENSYYDKLKEISDYIYDNIDYAKFKEELLSDIFYS